MSRSLRAFLLILLAVLAWQLLRGIFPQQERAVRTEVRETLQQAFPDAAEMAGERFGLRRLATAEEGRPEVVLLHGLDDPGKVWMNLAPALQEAGFGVNQLEYPNDQPIRESAAFVRAQLQALAGEGVTSVDLVAHSMGGLVARELLTAPRLACRPPACRMPAIRQLIMVGTPNHGSELARLRGLAEVREQLERVVSGSGGWLDWVFDGAGEAGLDLLPGSPFLQELNARPHPVDTRLAVIAGVIGEPQLQALQQLLDQHLPDHAGDLLGNGFHLSDGLVSLESARLRCVPLYRVPGTHLSIIRNVSRSSARIPPAVPLVLALLQSPQTLPDGPHLLEPSTGCRPSAQTPPAAT
jgi:pimeloyl-ACP methyl ester carboxylesterase